MVAAVKVRYGPLSNRLSRALAGVRAAAAAVAIWRRSTRHDRMWLLWAYEHVPPDERIAFAAAAAHALKRAWVAQMSTPAAPATDRIERIDLDEAGNLDDVAVSDVSMFRLEFMSERGIWIRLYRDGRPDLVIDLQADAAIRGWCEED